MGNLICCNRDKKKEYEEHLVRYMFCDQCQRLYLSNYEYSKHIYECNQTYKIDKIDKIYKIDKIDKIDNSI